MRSTLCHPLVGVALVLGAAVRLYNLDYDLPSLYEEATPFKQAWEMWNWEGNGFDLNPRFFNYPALAFYLHLILQLSIYAVGRLVGSYGSPLDLSETYAADPTALIVPARLLGVGFSLATVVVVARLGKRLSGTGPDLPGLAALVFALAPLSALYARAIIVDLPLTCFASLALLYATRLVEDPSADTIAKAGAALGLAAASKYTGALLVLPILAATAVAVRSGRVEPRVAARHLGLGVFLAGVVFLIANPYLVADLQGAHNDIGYEQMHAQLGHFGRSSESPVYYLRTIWNELGVGITVTCVVGAIAVCRNAAIRERWLPALVFAAGYLVIMSSAAIRFEHYLLPVLPVFCVLASAGLHASRSVLPSRLRKHGATILAALCLIQPMIVNVSELRASTEPHTRDRMSDWMADNLPRGSVIALEHYAPHLDASVFPNTTIPMDAVRPETVSPFYHLDWYDAVDAIVVSNAVSDRYEADPERFAVQCAFYRALTETWVERVRVTPVARSAPTLTLYQNPSVRDLPPPGTRFENLAGGNRQMSEDFLFGLGNAGMRAGRHIMAESIFARLRQIDPENRLYALRHADALTGLGRSEAAAEIVGSDGSLGDYERGARHYLQGRPDSAAVYWKRVATAQPHDPHVRYNLGALFEGIGNRERAIYWYREATRLTTRDIEPYASALGLLIEANRTEEAAALLDRADRLWPDHPRLITLRGRLAEVSGDLLDAERLYRAALDLDATATGALNLLAGLTYRRGQVDEAEALWERGLRIRPHYVPFYANLGLVRQARGRSEAAREVWRAGLRAAPGHPGLSHHLAEALASEGQSTAALAVLDSALARSPSQPNLVELKQAIEARLR